MVAEVRVYRLDVFLHTQPTLLNHWRHLHLTSLTLNITADNIWSLHYNNC